MADAVVVMRACVLRGEDARTGETAENTEVEDEKHVVDDGDGGHGNRADGADHQIVQHAHDVRDRVLDDHRYDDDRDFPVELTVPDEAFFQCIVIIASHACKIF